MRTIRWAAVICILLTGCGGGEVDKTTDSGTAMADTGADAATEPDLGGPTPDAGRDVGPDADTPIATASLTPETLQLAEGEAGTYVISLSAAADDDVTVDLASSDEATVTVSPAQLTFAAGEFGPRTVDVVAVDDAQLTGPRTVSIAHVLTATGLYADATLPDVTVAVTDDDVAAGTVNPTALSLGEGTSGTFEVSLSIQPSGPVTVTATFDAAQLSLSPMSLMFDASNYDTAQVVAVLAIDDALAEGPATSPISFTASGGGYDALTLPTVSVAISDNDVPGLVLSKMLMQTDELGATDFVEVSLRTQPRAEVEVLVTNVAPEEGAASPLTLSFDDTNWDAPQTVTITGVADMVADGAQTYAFSLTGDSTDPDYDGVTEMVAVTNRDADTAGVDVRPASVAIDETTATSALFEVSLLTMPTAPVQIPVSSSDSTQATVSTATLNFDAVNWSIPQAVTVTPVTDDFCNEGTQMLSAELGLIVSADAGYDGVDPADVTVTLVDTAMCAVQFAPAAGLTVSETGTTAEFDVVLTGEPAADVIIDLASSNSLEGTVSPASLTFSSANWNIAQTVTVTGVDDDCFDGDVDFDITTSLSSTDPAWASLDPADVTVTNTDDDTPQAIFSPAIGFPHTTSEAGGTASFTVALVAPGCPGPTADVLIPLSVTDTSEATIMPASLTFTAANADTPQTVTATGVDDADVDGSVPFLVVLGAATSQDPNWSGFDPRNVPMQNADDE